MKYAHTALLLAAFSGTASLVFAFPINPASITPIGPASIAPVDSSSYASDSPMSTNYKIPVGTTTNRIPLHRASILDEKISPYIFLPRPLFSEPTPKTLNLSVSDSRPLFRQPTSKRPHTCILDFLPCRSRTQFIPSSDTLHVRPMVYSRDKGALLPYRSPREISEFAAKDDVWSSELYEHYAVRRIVRYIEDHDTDYPDIDDYDIGYFVNLEHHMKGEESHAYLKRMLEKFLEVVEATMHTSSGFIQDDAPYLRQFRYEADRPYIRRVLNTFYSEPPAIYTLMYGSSFNEFEFANFYRRYRKFRRQDPRTRAKYLIFRFAQEVLNPVIHKQVKAWVEKQKDRSNGLVKRHAGDLTV